MIDAVWQWSQRKAPVIVIYFSSAYSPRVALDPTAKDVQRLTKSLEDAIQKVQSTTRKAIAIRNFTVDEWRGRLITIRETAVT